MLVSNISIQAARTFNGQYQNTSTRHGYTRDVFAPAYPQRDISETYSTGTVLPALSGSQNLDVQSFGESQAALSPERSMARSQTAPSFNQNRLNTNARNGQMQIRQRTRAMEPWTFQVGQPQNFIGTSRAYDPPIIRVQSSFPSCFVCVLSMHSNFFFFSLDTPSNSFAPLLTLESTV